MGQPVRRIRPLVGAVIGVVVAHVAAYVLAYPDPGDRAHELHATAHGYWHHAVAVAVVAGLVALAGAIGRGWRRGLALSTPSVGLPPLIHFAAAQLMLFTVMELVERLATGSTPAVLVDDPAFRLGLATQVVVAAVIVLLLQGVERAVTAIVRCLRPTRIRASHLALPSAVLRAPRCRWFSPAASRAPPRASAL